MDCPDGEAIAGRDGPVTGDWAPGRSSYYGLRCDAHPITPRPAAMRNAKDALAELSRPGPLAVLRGDLGMVGIPGVVFAPEEGLGLPAVAFGHDWLQPAERYADLLRHLASWGIVAAAPASHRGAAAQPRRVRRRPAHHARRLRRASGSATGGSASTPGAPRSPGTASAAGRRCSRRPGTRGSRRW